MNARGRVFKYGDNVDTDVIIPARYLNIADAKELSSHAMEDIDAEFVKKMKPVFFTGMPSISGCRYWNVRRRQMR